MIGVHQRFTPLQRLLHWLMAVCILAMLFIGVGMVSTTMPKYLPLVAIHKSLGIAILVLALIRLAVRLRYGAPALPADLPEPMKLAAHLSHYALYALMIGMPLLGWAMLSAAAYPVVVFRGLWLPAILHAERQSAYLALGRAFLPSFRVFRAGPNACRGGVVPCADTARRRVRRHGAGLDTQQARAGRVTEAQGPLPPAYAVPSSHRQGPFWGKSCRSAAVATMAAQGSRADAS